MLTKILWKLLNKPRNWIIADHCVATTTTRNVSFSSKAQHTEEPKLENTLNYNSEESAKILKTINCSDLEQLLNYDITRARARMLQSWKSENGPLRSTQDMLQVKGLSVKMMQKFCSSVLSGTQTKKVVQQPRQTVTFVVPSMGSEQRQQIRSCVAIRISVSNISWSRLELPDKEINAPCLLTDWQHHEINDKKLHLVDLVQRCLYIDHLIPAADCYLFESPQVAVASNSPGNAEQQNINIQKAQITAMLSFALAARRRVIEKQEQTKEQETPSCVFFLRRFLTARLFSHLVGTERVSSQQTVLDLMRTYYNVQHRPDTFDENASDVTATPSSNASKTEQQVTFRGKVQFPAELRSVFSAAERYQREFMGQALLLNLAFVRLVLLQDTESIEKVTRNPNKRLDSYEQSEQV